MKSRYAIVLCVIVYVVVVGMAAVTDDFAKTGNALAAMACAVAIPLAVVGRKHHVGRNPEVARDVMFFTRGLEAWLVFAVINHAWGAFGATRELSAVYAIIGPMAFTVMIMWMYRLAARN